MGGDLNVELDALILPDSVWPLTAHFHRCGPRLSRGFMSGATMSPWKTSRIACDTTGFVKAHDTRRSRPHRVQEANCDRINVNTHVKPGCRVASHFVELTADTMGVIAKLSPPDAAAKARRRIVCFIR